MRTNCLSFTSHGIVHKMPTASRAKSLGLSKEECYKILSAYEKALRGAKVSKHKKKRYELERKRFQRLFSKKKRYNVNGWVVLKKTETPKASSSNCTIS